jgi:hypothetical protein
MQFPDPFWLNDNVRRRNRLRYREVSGIDLPPLARTTWCWLWSMLERAVHVRRISSQLTTPASHGSLLGGLAGGAVQNIWVGRRNLVENGFWEAERFCDDGFRSLS